ncbi:MAG TPA: hypothetical protein VF951_13365, partial [Streptosporangiaceae bacterium]
MDDFIRQDNILQLRSIMAAVAARGRRWVPGRAVVPGSFIELTDADLEEIARTEHIRWCRRRIAAGWSAVGKNGISLDSRGTARSACRPGMLAAPEHVHAGRWAC